MTFRGVLFDWRGTLAVSPTYETWAADALRRLGRPPGGDEVAALGQRLAGVAGPLDAPGTDTDADLHRRTYVRVLRGLGLDEELVAALYAAECDPACNPFAEDAAETLAGLRNAGLRIGVISDIHVDLRPAFAAAGVPADVFTLSFEQGVQKPDPTMFTRTLAALELGPGEALMVGDRSRPDGAAVELGIATLLLPPLVHPSERRLHLVSALCGSEPGSISHAR